MGILDRIKNLFGSPKVEKKQSNIPLPATPRSTAPRRPVGAPHQIDGLVNLNINPSAAPAPAPVPTTAPAKATSSTHIVYSPDLIPTLEQEHQHLLQLFTGIVTSTTKQEHVQAQNQLNLFKAKLIRHLHLENLKLYIYLQYALSKSPEKFEEMRRFRKEMDVIGKVAMGFFDKYEKNLINSGNQTEFLSELNHLGQVLSNRINQEEKFLYPMYRATKI